MLTSGVCFSQAALWHHLPAQLSSDQCGDDPAAAPAAVAAAGGRDTKRGYGFRPLGAAASGHDTGARVCGGGGAAGSLGCSNLAAIATG